MPKIGAVNVDDLLAGVPVQLEHRQPSTEAVYNSQVCVGGDGKEIRTYRLERITWFIRGDRGHGGVAGLVFGAFGTGSGVVDEVNEEVGPLEGGGGPLEHGSGSLTASVEVVHDTFPERSGDDRAVVKHDDGFHCGEGVPVGVELLDLLFPGSLVIGDALLHNLVDHGVLGAGDAGRLQPGPGEGLWATLGRDAIDVGPRVHLSHAGHRVPHHQVLGGVSDGRHGEWRDPAGLSEVFIVLRGYIGLCSPVHRQPAGGVHDGGVRSPGHCVGDHLLLARDVVDRESVHLMDFNL